MTSVCKHLFSTNNNWIYDLNPTGTKHKGQSKTIISFIYEQAGGW